MNKRPHNLAPCEESEASLPKGNAILRNKLPDVGLGFISVWTSELTDSSTLFFN